MFVVIDNTYGGIDWHDSCTRTNYIKPSEDKFGFDTYEDAHRALIESIVQIYPEHESKIRSAFATGQEISFPIPVEECCQEPPYDVISKRDPEVITDNDGKTYYENEVCIIPSELKICTDYMFGQVSYVAYYKIKELKNPVYAVIENFLAPTKGVDSVERMYHKPFATVKEANDYIKSAIFHENTHRVQIYIAVFDTDTVNKKWLDLQYQIIELMDKFDDDMIHDDSFCLYSKTHLENLKHKTA